MSLRPREDSAANGQRRAEERTNWLGVCFGLALSCFVAFQQFKLPPVLPELLQQFHYPRALAASFMSVYALIGLLGSVPLGRWLKRRGYRAGLPLGIASTALGLILALGFARFGAALLLARALEGLTYAIFAITGPVIATAAARFRDLPLVTGLLAGWIPIGQIVAGLLALAVPQGHAASQIWGLADWQVIWLVALVLTLLLGLFCWRFSHNQDVSTVNSRAKTRETVTADTESVKSGPAAANPAAQAVSRPASGLGAD
ncbi:MAG TPA: MFS transporter, partial [Dongiaceae bacterium]|nr:MFS transporter [Dongiaceae bacterium]